MTDRRRSIAVRGPLYRAARAHYRANGYGIGGAVTLLIKADLKSWGVREDDPGLPELPPVARRARRTDEGPRHWLSVTGLLYRRVRVHAATMRLGLSAYVESLLEAELETAKPPPPKKVWAPTKAPGPTPLRPSRPARTEEDERRCEAALAGLGLSPGGVGLL